MVIGALSSNDQELSTPSTVSGASFGRILKALWNLFFSQNSAADSKIHPYKTQLNLFGRRALSAR